ncbi:hypothetical protein KZ813_17845 [Sphingomonas sp. RHCKR7]|uniref:hypothetical protein n=1 Tax=Sphingomonas folli TaxID=2862497 RepID=UPI001CA5BBCF|nr:hypothetical protein [Sphingomonas folli]MBW6528708.1 hypothetical protein [Sphingomonas folli]
MVAPLAVAAIGAAGSIFGGITGGKGAKKAANIAAQSASQDRALAQSIYNQNVGLAQPTVDRGNAAGAQINALLGLGGNTGAANDALAAWRGSTGYQTGLQEGQNSINTGYAAKGALESGAAQKRLLQYGTDYNNQNFGQYVGMLSNQQGAGLNALGAVTGAGSSYVQNVTNANQGAASAQAQAALYGAGAQQNALAGLGNLAGNYLSGSSYQRGFDNALGGTIRNQANNALGALNLNYFNQNPWG